MSLLVFHFLSSILYRYDPGLYNSGFHSLTASWALLWRNVVTTMKKKKMSHFFLKDGLTLFLCSFHVFDEICLSSEPAHVDPHYFQTVLERDLWNKPFLLGVPALPKQTPSYNKKFYLWPWDYPHKQWKPVVLKYKTTWSNLMELQELEFRHQCYIWNGEHTPEFFKRL